MRGHGWIEELIVVTADNTDDPARAGSIFRISADEVGARGLPAPLARVLERDAIAQTLERTGGNVKKTAQILNYNRPTLYRKLRRFGLREFESCHNEDPSDTELVLHGETQSQKQ